MILASSNLKQIYNCPYMLLYMSKEQDVKFVQVESFVKLHKGLARGIRVRDPTLRSDSMVLSQVPWSGVLS